ncbi:MAG: bifunctional folylpolyglutamate synthase/dihydrofolate synthase [Dehalococcoidia bacterium]|nr:bifunctional folylpolyglutamate synthase/dihydrofolate synthase [Dehalococcoidia bacterium]
MEFGDALEYLLSFTDMERGVQKSDSPSMSLASMRSLLGRLNDPHLGRRTIHVTGSKGKGSTAAMIAGILRREGLSTSLYTSPHLHSFTERITIDGAHVSPEEFAAGIEAIQPAVAAEQESVHGNVSTFGILTALFFWLTRAQVPRIEWQVVEVGLGGTYDATNVFETVDVAVITPISLEHTAILGNTTTEIAQDKAGIIKPGSICVLAPQHDPAVLEVVMRRCQEVSAELLYVPDRYEAEVLERHVYGQSFRVRGPRGPLELRTPLLGRHQVDNAMTALAVADVLRTRGHHISAGSVADGIAHTRVPGRLEVMAQRPLVVADGAHNGESAAALAAALRDYFEWRKLFLVIGTMRDKDVRAMGFELARLCELIVCTSFQSPRAMDPFVMIQEIGFLGPMAVAEASVPEAIETALVHADEEDLVCITGSLYVVAEARAYLLGEGATGE